VLLYSVAGSKKGRAVRDASPLTVTGARSNYLPPELTGKRRANLGVVWFLVRSGAWCQSFITLSLTPRIRGALPPHSGSR
jgi:hypothetical protein